MIRTERLDIRPPTESDRARMVELWMTESFMVFSGGVLDAATANGRFDRMLERAAQYGFAKQPVIERSSGTILGYSGVDTFDYRGQTCLEYGYRIDASARGNGYATEAALGLLGLADEQARAGVIDERIVYAMIDPTNEPSQNVAAKIGFDFLEQIEIYGYVDNLYTRPLG